jgi:hypothetical protein
MNGSCDPKYHEYFHEMQRILANKHILSPQDVHSLALLIEQLRAQYHSKGISFPAALMADMNVEAIQHAIRTELDKLAVRFNRNKCKMELFHTAWEVMADSYLNDGTLDAEPSPEQ